jgi:putative ABC transport system permease protein
VRTSEPEWVEIIGVVKHQRLTSLSDPGREQVYFTDGFLNFGGARKFAIRTTGDPSSLSDVVRSEVKRVSSDLLLVDMQPMTALVQRAQAGTRFQLTLIAIFAIVAALLVAVGLYGVLSTVVRQRTAEIGVRMAMGAAPSGILKHMVGQGLRLSVAGMVLGLIAAAALTRLMRAMLIGVTATDPGTYVVMTIVFLSITAVAAWLPARRAAALDPVVALRE